MAVYGDQLAFFHEQFLTFRNYSLQPETVAGFEKRVLIGRFSGVLQELKGGELVVEGETLNATEVPTLWTRAYIKPNTFVVPDKGDYADGLYKVTNAASHKHQGNFRVYTLQLVTGSTDEQTENEDVDFGGNSYD